ncbi:RHS repeat-associated core domain-containing protein [Litorimonas sp. WD9-15]|uniref:RHS repeat-associated core domain-containing protein n=1 Tax=Litorimonas sp. WD9-15 TaxID=3418716 RepID=UPI003CFE070E
MIFRSEGLRVLKFIAFVTACLLACVGFASAQSGIGDEGAVFPDLGDIQKRYNTQELSALTNDLAGDHIDIDTGALSFTVTDVSLPGNDSLAVEFTRTLSRDRSGQKWGDWTIGVPSISRNYVEENRANLDRCTGNLTPGSFEWSAHTDTDANGDEAWTGTRWTAHDLRGNIQHYGHLHLVHDMTNQPIGMFGHGTGSHGSDAVDFGSQAYLYDANKRRVKTVQRNHQGTVLDVNYNIFDAAGTLVQVYNATKGERTDYVDGPNGALARIKRKQGTDTVTFIHADHLGTARSGTGWGGQELWEDYHTPFGESLLHPDATDDQGDYTGHIRDRKTGLTYMQARYQDPLIGRFLSIDPVTFMDTGDPRYFNRYAYTANDPVNLIDPTGEAFGVASKVIKVAIKGGDVGAVLAGGIADAKTLTGRNVSLGRRLAAGASLATEIFSPVSARDAKAITNGASQLLKAEKIQGPPKVDIGLTNGRRTGGTPQTRLKVTEASGNTKDITRERVKAKSPNTHPSAPSGAMSNTKFDNPQPGSGGLKRDPTPDEVRMIDNVER